MAKLKRICFVDGCDNQANVPGAARGYCRKHYVRWKRNGDPLASKIDRETPRDGCDVRGCKARHHASGYCAIHYKKWKKHGDPLHEWTGPVQRWLFENQDHDGEDCLTWPFPVSKYGRGYAVLDGRTMSAPRAMCILAHGEPPTPKHHAVHSCGNGHEGCMNPRHLSWKLQRGQAVNTNKLSEAEVRAIRRSTEAGVTLAERYDVTPAAISAIRNRKTWDWLD